MVDDITDRRKGILRCLWKADWGKVIPNRHMLIHVIEPWQGSRIVDIRCCDNSIGGNYSSEAGNIE